MRHVKLAFAALLAVVLVAVVSAALAQDAAVQSVQLPLLRRDVAGGAPAAGDQQVGCAMVSATVCGALTVDTQLSAADPLTAYDVFVLVNGQWCAQDVGSMMSNQDGKAQVHQELKLASFPAGTNAASVQVVVKPQRSPFCSAYASDATNVPLVRACAQPAGAQCTCPCRTGAAQTCPVAQAQPVVQTVAQPAPVCPVAQPVQVIQPTYAAPAATQSQRMVIAQEFRLVDANGQPRGAFYLGAGGQPQLVMWGPDTSTPRIIVGLTPEGNSQIDLASPGGGNATRVVLSAGYGGELVMALIGSDLHQRASISLPRQDGPNVTLADATGKPRAVVNLSGTGAPTVTLTDGATPAQATIVVPDQGNPRIDLVDERGRAHKP